MADQAAMLKAFLLGAPIEAIAALIGEDAEAAIRRELRRLAAEEDDHKAQTCAPKPKSNGGIAAGPAARKRIQKTPKPAKTRAASGEGDGAATFCDLLRTTLASLGRATAQQIENELRVSGVPLKAGKVCSYLSYLRKKGDVLKEGDQWRLA
ncbi:MAG: hypothetical protein KatS3mg005_3397 [Bryobacteraceae bacterium]|nr:MAG: hypothetical protein KatS3mg005_3397 [Bryobacteraceae bacterium]